MPDPTSQLSHRIKSLPVSATIAMAAKGRELRERGIDVIDLSLGEPDFDTPQLIKDAGKKAIDENYSHYTPVSGYLELRKAISKKFKEENGLDYTPDQIVTSTGAKQSIANVALCLVDPGDEVIIPAPYWVSYAAIVQLAEGKMVNIDAGIDQDFKITPEQLEAAITPKSKLMIFSSPCNPTGSVYSKEELEALAVVLRKHPQLFIISDEIYEHINFTNDHASLATLPGMYDRVITVNGMSKGYAMTGWRLGYIGAPQWIAKACDKMQGQFTSATCSIAQKAAEAGLLGDQTDTRTMKAAFLSRRDLMLDILPKVPGFNVNKPQGAFYLFPDVSAHFGKKFGDDTIADANDLAMFLLNEAHVSTVTGKAFGNDNCIRMSYATSEDKLREAVRRISDAVAKLS